MSLDVNPRSPKMLSDTRVRRASGIDGLRGLAACAVLAFHFEGTFFPRASTEDHFLRYGVLGVELFFIISGFVILKSLDRSPSARGFARARAARILPTYWLSVLCALPFAIAAGKVTWVGAAANFTMTALLAHRPNFVTSYWTLTYELLFYVALGTLMTLRLLYRIELIALSWLAGVVMLRVTGFAPTEGAIDILLMLRFGHFFVIGMMLHLIRANRATWMTWLTLTCAVAYSGFGRTDWVNIPAAIYLPATIIFTALVLLTAKNDRTLFSAKLLVGVGTISYPLYLFHQISAELLLAQFPQAPPLVIMVAAVALAFTLAVCVHFWIELPAQRWLSSLGQPYNVPKNVPASV
jgi:peptidoglycan/LPS O-acetylase OafA/YrhL